MKVPLRDFRWVLHYSTIRIVAKKPGEPEWVGTGFVMDLLDDEGRPHTVLITARHVVAGATEVRLHFHETTDLGSKEPQVSGKIIPVTLTDGGAYFVGHPDKRVDLCGLFLGDLLRTYGETHPGTALFHVKMPENVIASPALLESMAPLEELCMIGYPNGIWDSVHNLPIARKGVAATPPGVAFNGRPEFLVDIGAWGGSSGSPVCVLDVVQVPGFRFMSQGSSALLVGVAVEGPLSEREGTVQVAGADRTLEGTARVNVPMGLLVCVGAREILVLKQAMFAWLKVQTK